MKEKAPYSEMEIRMALKNPGTLFSGNVPTEIKAFLLQIEANLKKDGGYDYFMLSAETAKQEILSQGEKIKEDSTRKMLSAILNEVLDFLCREFFPNKKEKSKVA